MSRIYDKTLIFIAVALAAIAPSLAMKACHDDYVDSAEANLEKAKSKASQWEYIASGYRFDAERLKQKVAELEKRRFVIRDTVYRLRGWRIDTLRLAVVDSLCPELSAENTILWEAYIQDSVMIDHQGHVIRLQDSAMLSLGNSIAEWKRVDSLNAVKFIRLRKQYRGRLFKSVVSAGLIGFFFGRI